MKPSDNILITGASGLVGRTFNRVMRSRGFSNLLTPSSTELDLRDSAAIDFYLKTHKVRYIFHFAAHTGGIGGSVDRPVEFLLDNSLMSMNIVYSAHKANVQNLLFLSSSCVYPKNTAQPIPEDFLLSGPLEPTNEGYSIAKIAGMRLCEYMNSQYGRNYMTLVPCNLYGLEDHFRAENSHVISALIYKMHKAKTLGEKSVEVWGTGQPRREFLYADDLADALIFFMTNFKAKDIGSHLNIGFGKDLSILELSQTIQNVVGFSGDLHFNISRPDGIAQKLLDVSNATRMGWSAKTDLYTGLKIVYDQYEARHQGAN